MKNKIGFITSFGLGGGGHTNEVLCKHLFNYYGEDNISFLYNKMSLPLASEKSRFDNYNFTNLIMFSHVNELNSYNFDVVIVHRSGDDHWALPHWQETMFNFKIIEINLHGKLETKTDTRIFPSKTLVNFYNITTNNFIIANQICQTTNLINLRNELNIHDKFVIGRVTRSDNDIYCDINLISYKQIEDENTIFLYVNPSNKAILDSKTLNIKNIIFIDGTTNPERLEQIYNTFDIHAHSNNIGETFGNSIAESIIKGIPTISHEGFANWPQAHEEFFINTPELYIKKENKNTMIQNYTKILDNLKTNIDYRNNVSKIQKDYAVNNFSVDIVIKKYIDVIDNI